MRLAALLVLTALALSHCTAPAPRWEAYRLIPPDTDPITVE